MAKAVKKLSPVKKLEKETPVFDPKKKLPVST